MKRFFFLFFLNILLISCARVGSPVGGSKDSIAPRFVGSNIDSNRVNVSQNLKELRIDFDEYVTLKNISQNLIVSPPLKRIKKILPSNIASKFVLIQWEDTLEPNTTYNFNFGNSIADYNEGNVLPYYNFAFSTGDKLDELYISGTVKKALSDSKTAVAEKEKSIVIGLYKDSDSVNFKQKPYYITKADEDGYYELNYLSPGNYRILAFEDVNGNSVYEAGTEDVGFQKEKIVLDKSISGLDLNIYPSKKALKYKEMKEIPGGILMTFEGHPNDVKVLSLNEKLKDYKVTHAAKSDSVNIWFDAASQNVGVKENENLKFSYDADSKKDTVSVFYKYNPKNDMVISNSGANLLAPNSDFKILSNMPVENISAEKWSLVSDSLAKNFTAKVSESNPNEILIHSDFKQGKKYQLTVPKETVSSFYKSISKSYRFDFEGDKIENYGSFTLKLANKPENAFWVQLLDEKGEILISRLSNESEIKFPQIKPGNYSLRILVDNNGNGRWDEADFTTFTAAEDAFLYPKEIEIKPLWEIVENWDLKAPADLKNTK